MFKGTIFSRKVQNQLGVEDSSQTVVNNDEDKEVVSEPVVEAPKTPETTETLSDQTPEA